MSSSRSFPIINLIGSSCTPFTQVAVDPLSRYEPFPIISRLSSCTRINAAEACARSARTNVRRGWCWRDVTGPYPASRLHFREEARVIMESIRSDSERLSLSISRLLRSDNCRSRHVRRAWPPRPSLPGPACGGGGERKAAFTTARRRALVILSSCRSRHILGFPLWRQEPLER